MVLVSVLAVLPTEAAEQAKRSGQPPAHTRYTLSYTPLYQVKADLDIGGSFDVQRHFLRFNANRLINRHWMVGLGLRFDYEYWDFSDVRSVAGVDLWDEIYRPGLSVPVFYMPGKQWRLGLIPSVEMAGATGAEAGESLS